MGGKQQAESCARGVPAAGARLWVRYRCKAPSVRARAGACAANPERLLEVSRGGHAARSGSVAARRALVLPPTLALQPCIRPANASAEKPPNTTAWMAPMRAQASCRGGCAAKPSGLKGAGHAAGLGGPQSGHGRAWCGHQSERLPSAHARSFQAGSLKSCHSCLQPRRQGQQLLRPPAHGPS